MAKEAKLLVILDEKGIHTEVHGAPEDVMFMAERALTASREALESLKPISHEDAMKLIDTAIESYQTEAEYGPEVAAARAFVEFLIHC